jgi:putative ABC transport system permease protein
MSLDNLLTDLRLAVRGLAKRPGFATAAVLTLALGIGANTAVFSIVDALLLRPLPFGEKSDRIITLHSTHPTRASDFDWDDSRVSVPDLEDFERESRLLEETAVWIPRNFTLSGEDETERVRGSSVSPNLFSLIGVAPKLGRGLRPEDAAVPGFEPVVLLSHSLWQRRFGSDPSIVGRPVRINRRDVVVAGVMPEGFRFPERDELWLPFKTGEPRRDNRTAFGFATLRPGVELAQAQEELAGIAARLSTQYPDTNRGWGVRLFAFRDQAVNQGARVGTAALLGAVAFVLLIGCANLANLTLARGTARQREMAVRTAVGAGRGDLVRLLLAEALVISIAGGVLGTLFAAWGLDAAVASFPEELPYWLHFDLDPRALAFTAVVSLMSAFAFGLLPALRASRPELAGELREGARSGAAAGATRTQNVLVAAEVALCLTLLVSANLMARSFLSLQEAKSGIGAEDHLLTFRVHLGGDEYDPVGKRRAFLDQAAEAIAALPGVTAAAYMTAIPTDDGGSAAVAVADSQPVAPGQELGVTIVGASPNVFEALATSVLEGRGLLPEEAARERPDTALVNPALARRLWPAGHAVGSRIGFVERDTTRWFTVVGIAPEVTYEEIGEATPQSQLNVYVPYSHLAYRSMGFVVRSRQDPSAVASGVRAAVRRLDPGVPVYDVRTMRDLRAYTTWEQRFFAQTMGGFAIAALLLACLGVYGVLTYAVSRRTHEIGVRLALGARPPQIVSLVVGEGARLGAIGIAAGAVGAMATGRVLASVLYGVDPGSAWPIVAMAALLLAVVLAASYVPARRAGGVDPMAALRED